MEKMHTEKPRTDDITWFGPRMELSRGIGILLVTLGHSEPIKTAMPELKNLIYSFHMPLFFFMSGFFSTRFLSRGLRDYILPRLYRLLIPYTVISASFFLIKWLVPGLVDRPVNPSSFFSDIFIYPLNNPALFLWFLYAIIIMKAITALLRFLSPLTLFFLSLLAGLLNNISIDFMGISTLCQYTLYFMGGVWVFHIRGKLLQLLNGYKSTMFLMLFFLSTYFSWNFIPVYLKNGLQIITAYAGTLMVISLSCSGYELLKNRGIEFLGRHSLEIYLLQYYFIFPVYYLMIKSGFKPIVVIPFTFIAGMGGSLLVIRYILPRSRPLAILLGSR